VLSVVALLVFGRVRSNRDAIWLMLVTVAFSLAVPVLGATVLFQLNVIGGLVWQLSLGSGIFVAFSIMGTPFYERLFAYARVEGTMSFLVFGGDMMSYVATFSIFIAQIFGPEEKEISWRNTVDRDPILGQFLIVLWFCGAFGLFLVVVACVHFRLRLFGSNAQFEPVENGGALPLNTDEDIGFEEDAAWFIPEDPSKLKLIPSNSGSLE